MNLSKFDLTDRTAIVTGGGQGIGKGICLALAQAGANIAVAEIDPATARATAREVEALGRKSVAIPTDVSSHDQVGAMVRQTVEAFGSIDILVNNAGGGITAHATLEMSEDAWDSVVDLNLKSVFLCCQAVARVMIGQKKGNIVNIASMAGLGPYATGMHYGAAKAGVINMTQSLAVMLGPHNIRVNAVAPGGIVTESSAKTVYERYPELAERRRKAVPLGRLGKPEDIAWVVVFLASDASGYVDGQVIRVDGALPSVVGLETPPYEEPKR
jgi:3-oxoacyl-[acyl-carrier protein] reductase